MDKKLVLEIGTEEIPSSCINEGIKSLKGILADRLEQERIPYANINTYGTPRRLTAIVDGLGDRQQAHTRILTGPPKKIAFDQEGNPSKAAVGFARSLSLDVSQLEEIETGRGVYMGKKILEEGARVLDIMPGLLEEAITGISFSKQMTWGSYDLKFARPIRWVLALWGGQVIDIKIENIHSGRVTYGLRSLENGAMEIKHAGEYKAILEKEGMVLIDPGERKEIIISSIHDMEESLWDSRKKVLLNQELLDEVVNLVEHPHVLRGSFSQRFLYIPKDILIKAIEYHQKYFAVLDSRGKVCSDFVLVQNGIEDRNKEIVKGNQRVLEARLSDAAFFYEEDKKHDFNNWLEKLKGVIFHTGLGSMHDKAERLKEIVRYIAREIGKTGIIDDLIRAAQICKCDLVTNMVVEFPQLQGIVGREYALETGEKAEVAKAVFEHYLPRFADDELPQDDTGAILSIADKIDTICGMFLMGKIPSGSEDPFALRRKASGIMLSILQKDYDLQLSKLIDFSLSLYMRTFGIKETRGAEQQVLDFILARYRFKLGKQGRRADLMDAVAAAGISSINGIHKRYKALEKYIEEREIGLIANPMTRCQNIIKGKQIGKLDTEILSEAEELELLEAVLERQSGLKTKIADEDYYGALLDLEEFGRTVDHFFDNILVMDKDEKVRSNRISLVKAARDLYINIADFSCIVIEG